jgi:hypothetical protein
MLRKILISDPRVPGSYSYALATTDAVEAAVRKNAAAQDLLAGKATPIEPDHQFRSFVDTLTCRDTATPSSAPPRTGWAVGRGAPLAYPSDTCRTRR